MALSTNALAHMPPEEVEQYADMFYVIRSYADAQREGLTAEDRAKAFIGSHLTSNAAYLEEGVERIMLFVRGEQQGRCLRAGGHGCQWSAAGEVSCRSHGERLEFTKALMLLNT